MQQAVSLLKPGHQDFWFVESIKDKAFEDCYNLDKELGKGGTSTVYRCTHKGTDQPWAVKIIDKEVEKKVIKTEIGILLKFDHKNIVKLHEVYETPKKIYLVLELVKGGELFDRISTRGNYSEKDAARAVKDVLLGVQHIHDADIVHRDLKPENLLYEDLTNSSRLKIADFGLSRIIAKRVQMKTVCGTPGYCAPEILKGEIQGKSADMWSIGVITFVLLCGYEPFHADDDRILYRNILRGDYCFESPYWDPISENAKDVIRKLLVLDPTKRLTTQQTLNHPWIQGVGARSENLVYTHTKFKEFNARRKLKAAGHAAMIAVQTFKQMEHKENTKEISDESQEISL